MKKLVTFLALCLVLCLSLPALADPLLSPDDAAESIATAMNAGQEDNPAMGTLDCAYIEDEDAFHVLWYNKYVIEAADSAVTGDDSQWTRFKPTIYNMYSAVRGLLDTFGYETSGLCFQLYLIDGEDYLVYYSLGDTAGGECKLLVDIVTNDTEPCIAKD